MTDLTDQSLSGVAETLLLPLYIRALETQRPDALLKDDKAVALLTQNESAFSNAKKIMMDKDDQAVIILRNREFDNKVRDFLARKPKAVVVHIGCGLDSRFDRVDNGQVEWYDLDLPEVIALRRKFSGEEGGRYHFLAYSAFDGAWLDMLKIHGRDPLLFLAEGVFMYFEETQIKSLVLRLRDHFPGAELVFDAFSPLLVRMNNIRFKISRSNINIHYKWGLKHSKDLEGWGEDISLLDEWFTFDHPEPRLAHIQWMRHIPLLARIIGIYHYRLGKAEK
jgi:methyltransferase (TIGR00027 family)